MSKIAGDEVISQDLCVNVKVCFKKPLIELRGKCVEQTKKQEFSSIFFLLLL